MKFSNALVIFLIVCGLLPCQIIGYEKVMKREAKVDLGGERNDRLLERGKRSWEGGYHHGGGGYRPSSYGMGFGLRNFLWGLAIAPLLAPASSGAAAAAPPADATTKPSTKTP